MVKALCRHDPALADLRDEAGNTSRGAMRAQQFPGSLVYSTGLISDRVGEYSQKGDLESVGKFLPYPRPVKILKPVILPKNWWCFCFIPPPGG